MEQDYTICPSLIKLRFHKKSIEKGNENEKFSARGQQMSGRKPRFHKKKYFSIAKQCLGKEDKVQELPTCRKERKNLFAFFDREKSYKICPFLLFFHVFGKAPFRKGKLFVFFSKILGNAINLEMFHLKYKSVENTGVHIIGRGFYSHHTMHHYRISILNHSCFLHCQTNLSENLHVC